MFRYAAARSTAANAKKVRVHFFGMDDIFSTLAALPAVPFKCTRTFLALAVVERAAAYLRIGSESNRHGERVCRGRWCP